jgi:hypothetical protein
MPTYNLPVVGNIDDNTDLWDLFQRDACGGFGFHYGELFVEVRKAAPHLVPKLEDIIRRGLRSADADERMSALHGAYQLHTFGLGDELEQLARNHPDQAASSVFIDVLKRQGTSTLRALSLVRQARLPADAQDALARALVTLQPDESMAELIAALDPLDRNRARSLLGAFAASPSFDGLVARAASASPKARQSFVELAFEAMRAEHSPDAYERWKGTADALSITPANAPPRPVETEEMRRFSEKMNAMINAAEAPAPAPPATVVLSSEVWVDALRTAEGPPAELFSRLRERAIGVLTSEAIIRDVLRMLGDSGWDASSLRGAEVRMRAAASVRTVGDAGTPEVTLANVAGVDTVYSVGSRTGQIVDGVAFRPVHELLSALRASPG